MDKNKKNIAHIYAQTHPEFASTIIGSSEALAAMMKGTKDALEKGEGKCILFTSDLKPYSLLLIRNDEATEAPFWEGLQLPYTEYCVPNDKSTHIYGPTEYFDEEVMHSKDLEYEIRISEEEMKKITLGCIKQGVKYGLPKVAKKHERRDKG